MKSLFGGVMLDSDDDVSDWPPEGISFPEVNISTFTETGQEESSITVPLQRAYTGNAPVISSDLADTPCATLGVRGLLKRLNTTLRTSHTLDTPSLFSLLKDCITNDYDFGMAYSLLRRIWYTRYWSTIRAKVCKYEKEDRERRRKALVGNQIVGVDVGPRRVWDLYSNRVVPWWITNVNGKFHWPQPISHAWVDEKDRADVWTPINGYDWPVPIPKESDLKLIRIEMLNLGAEYVWLDVLCLRQVGGPGEDMRADEWKLDVPMIGAVYDSCWPAVVIYLSGLGRPLSLEEGDLDSDRSWFRRAWTLQEIGDERMIAGDTPDGPMHAECKHDGKYETELLTRFHKQLQSTEDMMFCVFEALKSMQNRVSTNPVDKVAGLAYVMVSEAIPAYYESQSLEDAWTALVNSMLNKCRGQLFYFYPEPGNAGKKWRPSWDQLMSKPLPTDGYSSIGIAEIDRDETGDEDTCDACCIEKGVVRGLEGSDRRGELIVKDKGGIEHGFAVTATHTYPIPDDTYTLIDSCSQYVRLHGVWVVGQSLPGGKFEKVSVLELSRQEHCRLNDLDITEQHQYILI